MQIKNPTNEKIENVQIGTTLYTIEAEGILNNVPEEDARYWQENLHKFLILRKDKLEDIKEVEVVEIPTPKVEEVIEDTKEEEIVPEVIEKEVVEKVKVVKVKDKKK